MRIIPTLFKRDPIDGHLLPKVTPDCEWVLAGEGVATRMFGGLTVKYDGEWWQRTEVTSDDDSTPEGFVVEDRDEATDTWVGWSPVDTTGGDVRDWLLAAVGNQGAYAHLDPEADEYHDALALASRGEGVDSNLPSGAVVEGTYELCGPGINGNPEGFRLHALISHADAQPVTGWQVSPEEDPAAALQAIRDTVLTLSDLGGYRGIVWRHPDGRAAKVKAEDFRVHSEA